MKVMYHNADLDGKCSAAIAFWSPEADAHRAKGLPVDLIGMNYGDKCQDWGRWAVGEMVFILDFSLPVVEMVAMAEHVTLVWIDHHKSAREDARLANFNPMGLREDDKIAACVLSWQWFHPEAEIPEAVERLGEYDTWQNESREHLDYQVLPVQMGLRSVENEPDNHLWPVLLGKEGVKSEQDMISSLHGDGLAICRYQRQQSRQLTDKAGVAVEIGGHKVYAVNRLWSFSETFRDAALPAGTTVLAAFGWERSRWRVTLWPRPGWAVDVAEIAKQFGGGGHPGAAGFQCLELPFRLG